MSLNDIKTLKTINEVENYRKKLNEECDKRAEMIEVCCKANELSQKNFGMIKESFEAISPELFKTKEGKALMRKYTNTIKNSKNLSSLHSLYENIRKANKSSDVDFFINSIANENWNVDKKSIDEDCKKLGRVLAEAYILVGSNASAMIPSNNETLSNAVYFIAENKKSAKNIADYSNAVKIIRESILNNDEEHNAFVAKDLDGMVKESIEAFNKKYSSQLTEGEVDALKEVLTSKNKEEVFNKYKDSCSTKLSEAKKKFDDEGNSTASNKISAIMEQVSNKQFSAETIGNDVCNLIELSNIFD